MKRLSAMLATLTALAAAAFLTPADATAAAPTKVLVIFEENATAAQMKSGMPYLWSLATRYGYASNYKAITHPSLPNYLAVAGGSTYGITDDGGPAKHPLSATSVFGQAISKGKTAGVYAESMPSACAQSNSGTYAVRHTAWPYYTKERASCGRFDVAMGTRFSADAQNNRLPNVGWLIPNLCNDAHDCSLSVADNWLKRYLPAVLSSTDFTSGRLAVVVTADEGDRSAGKYAPSQILTVVAHASLSGKVVSTALTHYSLSRWLSQISGSTPLLKAGSAPDMKAAFGL